MIKGYEKKSHSLVPYENEKGEGNLATGAYGVRAGVRRKLVTKSPPTLPETRVYATK
jgi:hypothetical protein